MNLISSCERHYNILSDQFGPEVYFDSVIPFGINFNQNGFFMGNEIEACDLREEPTLEIEATENDLFTLVISSLDSNYLLEQSNNEVLHYGISNIKKIVTNTGHSFTFNRWAHYLPPIPAKGSGMIFVDTYPASTLKPLRNRQLPHYLGLKPLGSFKIMKKVTIDWLLLYISKIKK